MPHFVDHRTTLFFHRCGFERKNEVRCEVATATLSCRSIVSVSKEWGWDGQRRLASFWSVFKPELGFRKYLQIKKTVPNATGEQPPHEHRSLLLDLFGTVHFMRRTEITHKPKDYFWGCSERGVGWSCKSWARQHRSGKNRVTLSTKQQQGTWHPVCSKRAKTKKYYGIGGNMLCLSNFVWKWDKKTSNLDVLSCEF